MNSFSRRGWAIACVGIWSLIGATSFAARPPAVRLIPKNALAYVEVPDSRELVKRSRETALGQMSQDPQMKPFIDNLYAVTTRALAAIEREIGASLADVLAIPQGEFAFAVVETSEGRPPAGVLILDVGDNPTVVRKLVDVGLLRAEQAGVEKIEETIEGVKVTSLRGGPTRDIAPNFFEHEGAFVVTTSLDITKQILKSWKGGKGDVLADHQQFAAIMKRCVVSADEPPHVRWFVDPMAIVRVSFSVGGGNAIVAGLLPALGLDGLLGVGGAITMGAAPYDAVSHFHVLLDNPRAGIIEALAVGSGDVTPEPWVPQDVATYMTLYWDVDKTFSRVAKLFNSFNGDGALERLIQQNFSQRVEVDLEKEIIPALTGRLTYITRVEQPVKLNSQAPLLGLELKDPAKAQEIIDRLVTKYQQFVVKKPFGAKSYYQLTGPDRGPRPGAEPPIPPDLVVDTRPSFVVWEKCLLVTDRASMLEKCLATSSDASQGLAASLDYKLIASKVSRQAGSTKPGMFSFQRPEEGMRLLYGLATAQSSRDGLKRLGDRNEFFKDLGQTLEDNPLPPFAVIQKYLAPGGGVLTDDETGFHFMSFVMKRSPSGN